MNSVTLERQESKEVQRRQGGKNSMIKDLGMWNCVEMRIQRKSHLKWSHLK